MELIVLCGIYLILVLNVLYYQSHITLAMDLNNVMQFLFKNMHINQNVKNRLDYVVKI